MIVRFGAPHKQKFGSMGYAVMKCAGIVTLAAVSIFSSGPLPSLSPPQETALLFDIFICDTVDEQNAV